MPEISISSILTLGASSGLVAGLTNQGLGYVRDRAGYKHDRDARTEKRDYEQAMRSDSAHDASLPKTIDKVVDVSRWIHYHWGQDHGLDVDYHGAYAPKPVATGPTEVLENLNYVASRHSTKRVRDAADRLHRSLDDFFNTIDHSNASNTPEPSDYARWDSETQALLDLIHLPSQS